MEAVADLHIHSLFSDGILSPEELFDKAKAKGLSAISFTDHDSVDACYQGHLLKGRYGIEFINGVEFSCTENGKEYHILGYHFDIDNKELNIHLKDFWQARLRRAEQIIFKLNKMNINISLENVLERSGKAPITRPHIAKTLLDFNYVTSMKEAFNYYIGDNKPAYEAKKNFPVERAIKLLNDCGGLAVLAHPGRFVTQEVLYKLIKQGLDGIETIHPSHDEAMQKYYQAIAGQYWLLETGGSDYHGNREYDDDNFGRSVVPISVVDSIRYRAGKG